MKHKHRILILINFAVFCLFCFPAISGQSAFAQCDKLPTVQSAVAEEGDMTVFLTFGFSVDWRGKHLDLVDEASDKSTWTVFSPTLLQKAKTAANAADKAALYAEAMPDVDKVTINGARALKLTMVTAFQRGETYMVNVAGGNALIPAKCIGNPLPVKIIARPVAAGTGSGNQSYTKVVLAQAKERKDADVYVEGNLEGAKSAKTSFTVDASVGKKFIYNDEDPEYFWQPFFNIKASTNKKADPDSLNFGVKFENPTGLIPNNPFQIRRLYFSEAAKFEADKDFKSVNLVGDFRSKFVSRRLSTERINVVPFVGMEIGKNLKSPVDEIKGKLIARPLFGSTFYYAVYRGNEGGEYQRALSFETLYERRILLAREIALDKDDTKNFIGVKIGRAPRDYLKSSLTFDFAKNFGFKLNYEYGSLPPLFKLVDSKFSFGLVFKGRFQEKSR